MLELQVDKTSFWFDEFLAGLVKSIRFCIFNRQLHETTFASPATPFFPPDSRINRWLELSCDELVLQNSSEFYSFKLVV